MMQENTKSWDQYYLKEKNSKPFVPESFIARVFLSQRPNQILDSYEFKNKKILDIGCGNGRHIHFFNELGFNASGTEVSSSVIEKLKSRFPENTFFKCLSNEIPIESNTYDYVVGVNSLYYMNSENDFIEDNLKESFRILKPDGIFIASFVGEKHFILKNSKRLVNNNCSIHNNDHQCRTNIILRAMNGLDDIKTVFSQLNNVRISKIGQISDELDDKIRHLYYVIASKNVE